MGTNILVVDDSITHVELIKVILENENYNVFTSYNGSDVFETLESNNIDIILLDVILPGCDGFQLLQQLLDNEETKDIPIIMVTSLTQGSHVKKALDMGAMDYIKKPTEALELLARVHSAMRLKAKQDLLHEYAIRDSLTLLYNRTYGDKLLTTLIEKKHALDSGFCFAMIDVDYFKYINDTYGHTAGDAVLTMIGATLKNSIKSTDSACRYGGEEFYIILLNVSVEIALIVCERIRKNIESLRYAFDPEKETIVTVSIGVTHINPQETITSLELINQADAALYSAKRKGRNRIELYEEGLTK